MERCETCKFWNQGVCELVDVDQNTDSPTRFELVISVADDWGLKGELRTGPKFGCVRHESKPV